jgi:WD40 repeat protein
VAASADKTVRLWDAASSEVLQVLRGDGSVESAAFSPDASRLVTALSDSTARVWDVRDGEELQVLRGHEGMLWSAAFSPDGSRVVTASVDGTARVWETLPLDLLLAKAESRAARELTDAERVEYGLTSTSAPPD